MEGVGGEGVQGRGRWRCRCFGLYQHLRLGLDFRMASVMVFFEGFVCLVWLSITQSSGGDLVFKVLSKVGFEASCRINKF